MSVRMSDLAQLQKVLLAGILSKSKANREGGNIRSVEDSPTPLEVSYNMAEPVFQMKHSSFRKTARQRFFVGSFLLALLVLWGSTPLLNAQQPEDVVRTETALVQLNVGVVDPRGRAVTSLSKNDFTVYEDGVKQPIIHFEPTYAPFSLVLLLDTSGSTIHFRQQFKLAAWRFLDALAPEDRIAVIQFNAKVKKLEGFSTDRKKTAYAIQIADGAGDTHLYEALKYALQELDKEGSKRRKAIVVMTDGIDTQLREADRELLRKVQTNEEAIAAIDAKANSVLNSVLTAADRQGVSIYPLALPSGDPKRLALPLPATIGAYSAARKRLQALAERTGGRLNDIHGLNEMARLYAEVAAELRALYTVAYQARGERARDGKWHEIKIEVDQPELIVRTKPGYYSR